MKAALLPRQHALELAAGALEVAKARSLAGFLPPSGPGVGKGGDVSLGPSQRDIRKGHRLNVTGVLGARSVP